MWEKMTEGLLDQNQRKIRWVTCIYLMLSTSGALLLPELLRGWSLNRLVNGYLLFFTVVLGIGGLFLLWKFIRIYQVTCTKKFILICMGAYLVLQCILSILVGGIGALLVRIIHLERETVEIVIYYFSGIVQNIIRSVFLYLWVFRDGGIIVRKSEEGYKSVFMWCTLLTILWMSIGVMAKHNIPTIFEIIWNGCYIIGLYIVLQWQNKER